MIAALEQAEVNVGGVRFGNRLPLALIAGPCAMESRDHALEVAAAGGHNLLMIGAPGSGKSMLATRLPSILPELTPEEMLEVSMVHSLAGELMGDLRGRRAPVRSRSRSS